MRRRGTVFSWYIQHAHGHGYVGTAGGAENITRDCGELSKDAEMLGDGGVPAKDGFLPVSGDEHAQDGDYMSSGIGDGRKVNHHCRQM